MQPASEPGVGAASAARVPALLSRYVQLLGKRPAQVAVLVSWAVCGIAGLMAFLPFSAGLAMDVPPTPGTSSYDAAQAMKTYFPDLPFTGALVVQNRAGRPFVNFTNRSTCTKLGANVSESTARGLALDFYCDDAEALGGGCITTEALKAGLEERVMKVIQNLRLPHFLLAILEERFEEELTKAMAGIPTITACPERAEGDLTKVWMDYAMQVNSTLAQRLPDRKAAVQSLASVPSQTVSKTLSFPFLGERWNLTLGITLPAGQFWQLLASQLLADDASTSLLAVTVSSTDGTPIDPVGKEAERISLLAEDLAVMAPKDLHVRVSTMHLMTESIKSGIDKTMDLSTMTMPVALLILAGMAKNLRLVLITVINLVACISTAVLIMWPISSVMTVCSTAPSLMLATALAMSIDYSLFLLTRFDLEVNSKKTIEVAVETVLATSGRIVIVSGLTLLLCFLMMLVLPVDLISSMGVSAAVTVFTAVSAALSITPVLLLSCPQFFSSNRRWGLSSDGCCCTCCCKRVSARELPGPVGAAVAAGTPERSSDESASCESAQPAKSIWERFALVTRRFAVPLLVGLLAAGIPIGYIALGKFKQSVGLVPMMPTDSPATHTLNDLQDAFGVGALFPTSLVVVPPAGAMSTEAGRSKWLAESCAALQSIAESVDIDDHAPSFTADAFTGVMMIAGTCTTSGFGAWSHVGGSYAATQVMINYAIDPFSAMGQAWILRLRDAVQQHPKVAEWYITGVGPEQMDVANVTFARFPLMIALMMGVVLVLIGAAFGSLVAPLRAVVCLLWMLAVTFGLAIFVFQDGWLSFLNCSQLGPRPTGAMSWMSPCIAFSVLVGLGLDYDIFYSERVVEEWEHGHSEPEAAARALAATANVISAAGAIMAVAFFALLMCSTPTLNEIAFLLTVGILIDCFITTKIIIPCVTALLGRCELNFVPRKRQTCRDADALDVGLVAARTA